VTSHEADLQTKLSKAREEIKALQARLTIQEILPYLVDIPLRLEIVEHVPCGVTHLYSEHYGPHVRKRTVTATIRGLAPDPDQG
jgi:hypothetical protein